MIKYSQSDSSSSEGEIETQDDNQNSPPKKKSKADSKVEKNSDNGPYVKGTATILTNIAEYLYIYTIYFLIVFLLFL